jgi:2-oxoglutarate ferredoxin oxidoreductase subunit delta
MVGKVIINAERCKGCGLCLAACPRHALALSPQANKMGYFPVQSNCQSDCTGCGLCALMCPDAAIEVYRADPAVSGRKA